MNVNQTLKHAVATFEGKHPKALFSDEGMKMPWMPKLGDVDFMYGGEFCCQVLTEMCLLSENRLRVIF